MVGGVSDVESRYREAHERAKIDGGDGWMCAGSRSLECFREYVWTEF